MRQVPIEKQFSLLAQLDVNWCSSKAVQHVAGSSYDLMSYDILDMPGEFSNLIREYFWQD